MTLALQVRAPMPPAFPPDHSDERVGLELRRIRKERFGERGSLARLDAAYEAGAYPPDEYAAKRRGLLAERVALEARPREEASPPPDPGAARVALAAALTAPNLAETAARLHLRGVLHAGLVLDLTVDV